MESNKKSLYTIISILSLISVQVIMRSIGIDNISAHVYILLLSIACIMVIIGVYKNGTKGLGVVRQNIAFENCISKSNYNYNSNNYPVIKCILNNHIIAK